MHETRGETHRPSMMRLDPCLWGFAVLGIAWFASPVHGQSKIDPETPISPAAAGDRVEFEAVPTIHALPLEIIEEGLLAEQASKAERTRWATVLSALYTDESRKLIVRVLGMTNRVGVLESLLEQLHIHARRHDRYLYEPLAGALLPLLQHPSTNVRSGSSRLLALYDNADIVRKIGLIAKDPEVDDEHRLSALDALAPNIHRASVLQILIDLLAADSEPIRVRASTVLAPAASVEMGADVDAWRAWWEEAKHLSDAERLSNKSPFYRIQHDKLKAEFEEYRKQAAARLSSIETRLEEFQRESVRSLNEEQWRTRIVDWLGDPLPEIVRTAISIVKAKMADEGVFPDDPMITALLGLLNSSENDIRKEVLLIVQKTRSAQVLGVVLQQLKDEADQDMRLAFFRALGELRLAEAMPALIAEIKAAGADEACVREAATAIDSIAGSDRAQAGDYVLAAALIDRYQATAPEKLELRAALLSAMAGVGDETFQDQFRDALMGEDPTIVRPAIRGLRTIGDRSRMARVRTLSTHPDPLVRLAAIDAIGELGREQPDLESLLQRILPANEDNALVRDTAWRSIRAYVTTMTLSEQIALSDRLKEVPERELDYLEWLTAEIQSDPGQVSRLGGPLERLCELYLQRKDGVRANGHLRSLYRWKIRNSKSDAMETGIVWLGNALHAFPQADPRAVVEALVQDGFTDTQWERLAGVVKAFAASDADQIKPEQSRRLVESLREMENLPAPVRAVLDDWHRDLTSTPSANEATGSETPAG